MSTEFVPTFDLDDLTPEQLDTDPGLAKIDRRTVETGTLWDYVQLAWRLDRMHAPLTPNWHMKLLCDHLDAVLAGDILDLDINVPPGMSKSSICSIHFPCYAWIKRPDFKMILVSYDGGLASDFSSRALQILTSPWWQARWPEIRVLKGSRANLGMYDNNRGGRRISAFVGGPSTGKHAHMVMFDDPIKPGRVQGDPEAALKASEDTWRLLTGSFFTRKVDPPTFRRVGIMQRLHDKDPSQRLRDSSARCVHLCLPQHFDPSRRCSTEWGMDPRTEEGELLFPDRYPADVVEQARVDLGPAEFALQHEQLSVPATGHTFEMEWFERRWTVLPPDGAFYISTDASFKDHTDSDWFVAQVWLAFNSNYYALDQIRGRWAFPRALAEMTALISRWPQVGEVLIEDKANGPAIIASLRDSDLGVKITEVTPAGGKTARAQASARIFRNGRVLFPQAFWVDDPKDGLREEARVFPKGGHDDQVDAMTQFLTHMIMSGDFQSTYARAMGAVTSGAAAQVLSALEKFSGGGAPAPAGSVFDPRLWVF